MTKEEMINLINDLEGSEDFKKIGDSLKKYVRKILIKITLEDCGSFYIKVTENELPKYGINSIEIERLKNGEVIKNSSRTSVSIASEIDLELHIEEMKKLLK